MKRTAILLLILAVPAFGQNFRSWVASGGLDTNDCSRSSPCRTFGRAIDASISGAEVVVLDSAGYGPVVIDKAVSIIAPLSVHAVIAPSTGLDAITVSAGFSAPVILRGLYLNGRGADNGILHEGNNPLIIENCVVNGFQTGLFLAAGTQSQFLVSHTTIRDTVNAISWEGAFPGRGVVEQCKLSNNLGSGVRIAGSGNFLVRNTLIADNSYGVYGNGGGIGIQVIDCAVTGSSINGIAALAQNGSLGVNLEHCVLSRNQTAIKTQNGPLGTSIVRVSNSVIMNNTLALDHSLGGSLLSRVNNTLADNNGEGTFTGTFTVD